MIFTISQLNELSDEELDTLAAQEILNEIIIPEWRYEVPEFVFDLWCETVKPLEVNREMLMDGFVGFDGRTSFHIYCSIRLYSVLAFEKLEEMYPHIVEQDMPVVDLMAAGYEWNCSKCYESNLEVGSDKEIVTCEWCNAIHRTGDTIHPTG